MMLQRDHAGNDEELHIPIHRRHPAISVNSEQWLWTYRFPIISIINLLGRPSSPSRSELGLLSELGVVGYSLSGPCYALFISQVLRDRLTASSFSTASINPPTTSANFASSSIPLIVFFSAIISDLDLVLPLDFKDGFGVFPYSAHRSICSCISDLLDDMAAIGQGRLNGFPDRYIRPESRVSEVFERTHYLTSIYAVYSCPSLMVLSPLYPDSPRP